MFGHCAEVRGSEGKWLRVRGAEGYEGWVHEGYTEVAEGADCDRWGWDPENTLSLGCSVRDSRGTTMNFPLGAILRGVQLLSGASIGPRERMSELPAEADAIVASASKLFAGTYYQWGGVTPWGADCSGLVQTVHALHGVKLLRDAWQQATQGVHVEGGVSAIEPADLLFFSDTPDSRINHVAMAVSRTELVHLALGRGGYHRESLDQPDEYVTALMSRFRFARKMMTQR